MTNHARPLCLLPILLAAVAAPAPAALPAGAAHAWTLPNGLEVVLLENHSNPVVSLTTIVRSGRIDEPPDLHGASHFLEHLLFNGTATRTQRELYDAGDLIGAYNNAQTRTDCTIFMMLVPRPSLREGMDLQSDMLFHSVLPQENFEKERGIVIEEIGKDRDREEYRAAEVLDASVWAGTPLAGTVLGTPDSIRALPREKVLAFYRARYVPGNMVLFAMGDVTRGELEPLLRETYGKAPAGKAPAAPALPGVVFPEGGILRTLPLDAAKFHVRAVLPAPPAEHPDVAHLETLASLWNEGVLTGGSPPPLSLGVNILRGIGALEVEGTADTLDDASNKLMTTLEKLRAIGSEPVPAGALRARLVRERVAQASLAEKPHYFGMMSGGEFARLPVPAAIERTFGDPGLPDPSALARIASTWLAADRFRATIAGPGLAESEVPGHRQRAQPGPAARPAAPADGNAPGSVLRATLPNGMEVVVSRSNSEIFAVHLLARDRAAREPAGRGGIAEVLHRCLVPDTKTSDGMSVETGLDAIGATVKVTDDPNIPFDDYYFTAEFSYVRLETVSDYASQALSYLADAALRPALTDECIAKVKGEVAGLVRREAGSARERARRLFRETLFGSHPLARPVLGTEESLAAITPEETRAFHAAYFSPGNLILSVVSSLPPEMVVRMAEQSFGSAPAGPGLPAVPPLPRATAPREIRETIGRGQSVVVLGGLLDVDRRDLPALLLGNSLLSDRIAFDLREKQGLAYNLGASVSTSRHGSWFVANIATRPENIEKAVSGIRGHIASLPEEEIAPRELERTINQTWGRSLMRRLASIHVAYSTGLAVFEGRDPGAEIAILESMRKVTPAEVRAAVRKYLAAPTPLLIVVE